MPKVINIPKYVAENFKRTLKNTVWISISEPGEQPAANLYLDTLPNLKIVTWDITKPILINEKGKILKPLNKKNAQKVVKFIRTHLGENILVNCAAGISRSGAVAQFCETSLGYQWPDDFKSKSLPNNHITQLLIKEWATTIKHPTQI